MERVSDTRVFSAPLVSEQASSSSAVAPLTPALYGTNLPPSEFVSSPSARSKRARSGDGSAEDLEEDVTMGSDQAAGYDPANRS